VLGVYLLVAVLLVLFTIAMTLSKSLGLKTAAFGALVATFPNSGFMGVPLLVALMGAAAAGTVISAVLADMVVTSSLCLALASLHGAKGRGPAEATRNALTRALSNPLAWAIALGGTMGAVGYRLLGPADVVVGMLADAASPVALFTVGAMLYRAPAPVEHRTTVPSHTPSGFALTALAAEVHEADIASVSDAGWLPTQPTGDATAFVQPLPSGLSRAYAHQYAQKFQRTGLATHTPQILTVAMVKLLLHPLAVLLMGASARALGAPLTGFQLTVLTLVAALPSASNVSLLAEREGADTRFIARVILITTTLGMVSFTLLAWAMHVKPVG
jgi:predicted permease